MNLLSERWRWQKDNRANPSSSAPTCRTCHLLEQKPELAGDYVLVENVLHYSSTFCFSANPRGRYLQTRFDKTIPMLVSSGELKQLMQLELGSDDNYPY